MHVLGVQVEPPFMRFALIERSRRGVEILCLKSATLADPGDVKQLYIASFQGQVVSGLSAKNLLIRSLEMKGGGHRHLEEVVAFQSEATTHFEPSDVLSVPHIIKQGPEKTEALLFTAPREAIRDHLLELEKWDLNPDLVSAVPLALVRYVQWKIPALTDAFLVDLGSSEWTCVWMEKGHLKKSHAIAGGIEILLSALWEDRKKILFQKEVEGFAKQIDLLQLKGHLNPHLSAHLNEMRQDLAKIIYSMHRISGAKPILFTGRVDAFGHLRDYLIERFKDSISGECNQAIPLEEQKYAIPIGLALEHGSNSLQLRREEFFPQKNWKRAGLFSLCLVIASLLLAGGLFSTGNLIAQRRKTEMIGSLQSLLDRWDSSLKQTIFSNSGDEGEILDRWSRAVASNSKEYPFILAAPKVSDAFLWLNNHPLLQSMKKDNDPLEILSLRYQLLKFPKVDAPQEPYLAKVELEFKAKSPLNARKFHEALLKGDELIDSSLEVNWEALNDLYRVSFYLKNRSPHVP
jgi:hypothetical protein